MYVHTIGVGVPTLRVAAADIDAAWGRDGRRGQIAACAPDEDVLTLSWSAATMALAEAGVDAADVEGLWWGTARPPFAEGPSHAVLADDARPRPARRRRRSRAAPRMPAWTRSSRRRRRRGRLGVDRDRDRSRRAPSRARHRARERVVARRPSRSCYGPSRAPRRSRRAPPTHGRSSTATAATVRTTHATSTTAGCSVKRCSSRSSSDVGTAPDA